MIFIRNNSLSPLGIEEWRWNDFMSELMSQLSVFELHPCEIPNDFLYKKIVTGSPRNPLEVITSTWACKFKKIKQIRVACIKSNNSLAVFNLLIHPSHHYDLPFFGADFVTLPNGHLLALDLQPVLKADILHTNDVWSRLIPIHNQWQSLLPSGGQIPKEAESFFSPAFLWTRLPLGNKSDRTITKVIKPAFIEYLSFYIKLLKSSVKVSSERSLQLLEGQKSYITYRSTKDPARGMLTRFYGKDWTEDYIHKVLFQI